MPHWGLVIGPAQNLTKVGNYFKKVHFFGKVVLLENPFKKPSFSFLLTKKIQIIVAK